MTKTTKTCHYCRSEYVPQTEWPFPKYAHLYGYCMNRCMQNAENEFAFIDGCNAYDRTMKP